MPDLSPSDRDLLAKTILGEAGDQSPEGQAAVAHVIKNRLESKSGEFGNNRDIGAIVQGRNQFEAWSPAHRERTVKVDPKSREYKTAAGIADDVFGGKTPDPTNGATYFYSAKEQAKAGRKPPAFATMPSHGRIGDHEFFSKSGPADVFEAAGLKMPTATAAAASPEQDVFEAAGLKMPTGIAAVSPAARPTDLPPGAADVVQVPGGGRSYVDASGKFLPPEPNPPADAFRDRAVNAPGPGVGGDIAGAFHSARDTFGQGLSDIRSGLSAKGVGEAAFGGAGMLTAIPSGLIHAFIGRPAAQLGGPEAGERAETLAGVGVPARLAGKAAVAALPSNRAVNQLVEAIGPENVPEAVNRLRSNERLAPMDVSPTVQQLTQGLAVQPGRAQNVVAEATKARGVGAREAVGEAYNELGPPPKALEVLDQIKDRARETGRKEIQPALDKAGPVDVSPVIAAIDAELKPGMQAFAKSGLPLSTRQQELARLRQQLVTETGEMRIDPQRLHEVQSANGTAAYQFSKSLDAAQKQAGAGLRDINEKLVDAIDKASGGAYRPARAKFAEAKDVHEAFDRGLMLQRARQGEAGITEDSPQAWSRWAAKATPDQLDAARLGALSAMHMKIGSVRNAARAGMDIPEVEFTRDKLGILFGKDKADKMIQQLRDERDIAATNSKLFQGSQTAARLKGEEALAVRKVGGGNPLQYVAPVAAELLGQSAGFPLVGLAGTTALKGAHLGWQKIGQMSDLARNTAFARAATSSGQARDDLINRLVTHPKVVRVLKKSGNQLTATP